MNFTTAYKQLFLTDGTMGHHAQEASPEARRRTAEIMDSIRRRSGTIIEPIFAGRGGHPENQHLPRGQQA